MLTLTFKIEEWNLKLLFNLLFKSQWQILFDTKLKKLYVLDLVVQVFFSDIISEEPMLQFEYLHIHEPVTCMGEY